MRGGIFARYADLRIGRDALADTRTHRPPTSLPPWAALEASELSDGSKGIYMDLAENFVRWLEGDFNPGSRKEPYPIQEEKERLDSLLTSLLALNFENPSRTA